MIDSSVMKKLLPASITGLLLWGGSSFQGMGWPILLVALVPLLHGIQDCTKKQAAVKALVAGMVYHLLLLYWIVIALGRYGGLGWYITLPTLGLLSLYMSLYFVMAIIAYRYLVRNQSFILTLWLLPCVWVGLDWVRSFLFSGFPWMDLGYNLWNFPRLIQIADLFGHYGLTFLLVMTNVLLTLILISRTHSRSRGGLIFPVLLLLVGATLYSNMAWKQELNNLTQAPRVKIGIVQGNIDQSKKWLPEEQRQTVLNYLGQSAFLYQESRVDLLVWPETALPFFPGNSPLTSIIQKFLEKRGGALLTGSPWYNLVDLERREIDYYNGALLFQSDGSFDQKYFKSHLVPFGEYVPLKKLLFFLGPLVEAVGDFSTGKVETPLAHGDIRAGALICFESIFPTIARQWVERGANVLVNLTNDAWYGRSSAPEQSFAMSVFRAVETRRSLVRSANTGISGVIDPLGRVEMASDIFVPWAEVADVALLEKKSVVVSWGYRFAPLCLIVSLLFFSFSWWAGRAGRRAGLA